MPFVKFLKKETKSPNLQRKIKYEKSLLFYFKLATFHETTMLVISQKNVRVGFDQLAWIGHETANL